MFPNKTNAKVIWAFEKVILFIEIKKTMDKVNICSGWL